MDQNQNLELIQNKLSQKLIEISLREGENGNSKSQFITFFNFKNFVAYLRKQQNQNIFLISMFGASGSGKSFVGNMIINYFKKQAKIVYFKVGSAATSETSGVDYCFHTIKPNQHPITLLVFDVQGSDGNETLSDSIYDYVGDQINQNRNNIIDMINIEMIKLSHISLYITNEERVNPEDILSQEYQPFKNRITLIFNRLSEDKLKNDEMNQFNEFYSYTSIPFVENEEDSIIEGTSFLSFLETEIEKNQKQINKDQLENQMKSFCDTLINRCNAVDNSKPIQPGQPYFSNLIGIKENNNQFELQINEEVLNLLKELNKKCTVISFLGRSGEGKSTTANQFLHQIDKKIVDELFQVGYGFATQTKGADCVIYEADDQVYIIIDLEGIYGYATASKDQDSLMNYLITIFNVQCIISRISTVSYYVKSNIRVRNTDISTLQIIEEFILQQFQEQNQNNKNNFENSVFIFNKLNEMEKQSLSTTQGNQIKYIKEKFGEKVVGMSYFKINKDNSTPKLQQIQQQNFGQDIKKEFLSLNRFYQENDNRKDGQQLAKCLNDLVIISNKSEFSLSVQFNFIQQLENLFKEQNKEYTNIIQEINQKFEEHIKINSNVIASQTLINTMFNQGRKQMFNMFLKHYQRLNQSQDVSLEKNKNFKQIKLREKIKDLYLQNNPNKQKYLQDNLIQNQNKNGSNNNQLNNISQYNTTGVTEQSYQQREQALNNNLSEYRIQKNQFDLKKATFEQQHQNEYGQSSSLKSEYNQLKSQKRAIQQEQEFIVNNQNQFQNQNFRNQVAFAGIASSVGATIIMNLMLGKYKNNKSQMLYDGLYGAGLGGTMYLLSQTSKNFSSPVVFISMMLIEQVFLYNNKYHSLKKKLTSSAGSFLSIGASVGAGVLASYGAVVLALGPFGVACAAGVAAAVVGLACQKLFNFFTKKSFVNSIIDYFVKMNVNVSQQSLDEYLKILQLNKDVLKQISNKHNLIIDKYAPQTREETKQIIEKDDIQKLKIVLLYFISMIATNVDKKQKESMNETDFNKINGVVSDLEAFTYYYDFNYIEIGQELYTTADSIKNKITKDEILKIINNIPSYKIKGNNSNEQSQERRKQYCKFEDLQKLVEQRDKNIKIRIPQAIQSLKCEKSADLWATYICIQILQPSYVFQEIFFQKINYELEQKSIFFVDCVAEFSELFKQKIGQLLF